MAQLAHGPYYLSSLSLATLVSGTVTGFGVAVVVAAVVALAVVVVGTAVVVEMAAGRGSRPPDPGSTCPRGTCSELSVHIVEPLPPLSPCPSLVGPWSGVPRTAAGGSGGWCRRW